MIHPAMIVVYKWFYWMKDANRKIPRGFDPDRVFFMNEHGTIYNCDVDSPTLLDRGMMLREFKSLSQALKESRINWKIR